MRELERNAADTSRRLPADAGPIAIAIVGRGRVGGAVAAGLRAAGHAVEGPLGRDEAPSAPVVLLCVPDGEIEAACRVAAAARPTLVGHTSGATPLSALVAAAEAGAELFGLHPLQTIAAPDADLRGAGCAVGGSSERALTTAGELASALGMTPFAIRDDQRAAYHAAASIASNYLLALEATAEEVAAGAGIAPADARALLGPLVRQTVENWLAVGPAAALTGPVARGDEATVRRQQQAIKATSPAALPTFEALTEATRRLADSKRKDADAPPAGGRRSHFDLVRHRTSRRDEAETGPAVARSGARA
jgi:predicted short-subunit dehydrogenase-like oxidoreductase (DUF2520 family)